MSLKTTVIREVYGKSQFTIESGCWLVLCYLLLTCAYYGVGASLDSSPAIWFQRSGSVIVCIAIIAEIRMLKLSRITEEEITKLRGENTFTKKSAISWNWMVANAKTKNKLKGEVFLRNHIHLFLIIGTITWGYGDIIFTVIGKL
tara:strand:- start:11111 stop:11545 length:435 start_codon:yes stop_codon:yes gene_type:complete